MSSAALITVALTIGTYAMTCATDIVLVMKPHAANTQVACRKSGLRSTIYATTTPPPKLQDAALAPLVTRAQACA